MRTRFLALAILLATATAAEAQQARTPRPSLATPRLVAVDRLEGDIAVLVDADGRQINVPLASLPAGTRENSILRITLVAPKRTPAPRTRRDTTAAREGR